MAKNKTENVLITLLTFFCITMIAIKVVPTLAGK